MSALQTKAEVLAHVLESVYNIDTDTDTNTDEQRDIMTQAHRNLNLQLSHKSEHEMVELLTTPTKGKQQLRATNAPGSDDVDARMVKNMSRMAVVELSYIINATIILGQSAITVSCRCLCTS